MTKKQAINTIKRLVNCKDAGIADITEEMLNYGCCVFMERLGNLCNIYVKTASSLEKCHYCFLIQGER